jgi:hypothetical protein
VFYVHASGTFACGATLASTCKYLEAAPTSGTAAWTDAPDAPDAPYAWSGNMTVLIGATAQGTVIGTGLKNTEAMVTQSDGGNTASRAGTITRAYRGPNNLTDWYLPSKDELAELYAKRDTVGISAGSYWSSSERAGLTASRQSFGTGNQFDSAKGNEYYVRPVRAFSSACANGGACALGDIGPGGGKVFYVASSNFTSTDSNCGTACKYLEAAPSDHSSTVAWCSITNSSLGVTGTGIGSGMSNTTTADSSCTSGAIQVAADYTNNSKTDWHLPSKDELAQLYIQRTTVGGFSTAPYWSSSAGSAYFANFTYFRDLGYQSDDFKASTFYVRPVRAFG